LLIRKADAEAFDFAKKLGDISLSLGSPSADDKNIPEGEPSEAALTFMQDLQEYRAEQERLRAAGEIEDDSDSVSVASAPKKATFRTTQIVNGRMIIYEWREGESLPRIVGDTGENQASTTGPSGSQADGTGTTTMPTFEDDLSGSDSPFFESEGGQESEI
jgi:pilus assembly protein CpaB